VWVYGILVGILEVFGLRLGRVDVEFLEGVDGEQNVSDIRLRNGGVGGWAGGQGVGGGGNS